MHRGHLDGQKGKHLWLMRNKPLLSMVMELLEVDQRNVYILIHWHAFVHQYPPILGKYNVFNLNLQLSNVTNGPLVFIRICGFSGLTPLIIASTLITILI